MLAEIRGLAEEVIPGPEIHDDFCHDELAGIHCRPEVLVRARSTEEVSRVMKYAYEHHVPVTPRGQGTGLVGGSVARCGGIMLDLSKMNRVLEVDEENLTLTLEPGVLLMEIAALVEPMGLFYPPDPGEKSATIGGNISTNAGGMRAVKYGVTRDYVRGLEVVLPDGRVIELGGKVVKNSSGYSLLNLIVGSEGTLGIVTKAILRLLPLPRKAISLLVPFPNLASAIETVPLIIKSKAIPTAIEFMEKSVILAAEEFLGRAYPDKSADAYLLLTFDGNSREEIESAYDAVAKTCIDNGALAAFLTQWKAMYDAGALINESGSADMFIAGDLVMMTNSSSNVAPVLEKVNGAFEVGVGKYLRVSADASDGATVAGSCLSMFDSGDDLRKEASWVFIQYLASAAVQADFAANTGYVMTGILATWLRRGRRESEEELADILADCFAAAGAMVMLG